jgi:hypothetical protein
MPSNSFTMPDRETLHRIFAKHGGHLDGQAWRIHEDGLSAIFRELAAQMAPAQGSVSGTASVQSALTVAAQETQADHEQVRRDLDRVYAAIGIGEQARTIGVLLTNIENAMRRFHCLSAIEGEFFTKEVLADDPDEPGDTIEECPLNWGAEPAKYVEQFRGALDALVAERLSLTEASGAALPDLYFYGDHERGFECPDDAAIVSGRNLGDHFTLRAAWYADVEFEVTKVPDDIDDDYVVREAPAGPEPLSADAALDANIEAGINAEVARKIHPGASHIDAWIAVCRTLWAVAPNWYQGTGRSIDKACVEIRRIAARADGLPAAPDVEQMLKDCVPGGSICDPQSVADSIREWFDKRSSDALAARTWPAGPPTEQGLYWHWTGDLDTRPIPLNVLWSGSTKKCFVAAGQYGITQAVDCEEYGGYWKPAISPAMDEEIGFYGSDA